ncbi:MAG: hypothetical protein JNK05_03020 [Myxococcales bacterium]|nr:hypothetical protein [Myxococcales bacterium]
MHCQRSAPATVEDVVLGGPRTLGFIELRGAIPAPNVGGGAPATSVVIVDDVPDPTDDASALGALGEDAAPNAIESERVAAADAGAPLTPEQPTGNEPARIVATPPAPWTVRALSPALARAIDDRGHRIALVGDAIVDETAGGRRVELAFDDQRCDLPFDTIAFDGDGAGYLVRRGRVFLKAPHQDTWERAAVCNNLLGNPWVYDASRGWRVLSRRGRSAEPAILSHSASGELASGWTAISGARSSTTHAVVDVDNSRVVLESGGHPLKIDVTLEVAGAILATASVPFQGITRTRTGVVVWREDTGGADVDLLFSTTIRGQYQRARVARDAGARAGEVLGVWAAPGGARVIVTRRGVELFEGTDVRAHAHSVARWSTPINTESGISVGWLSNGKLAVVTPNAWAVER